MKIDSRTTGQFSSPYLAKPSRRSKAAVAFASVLISCTLLGSMLSLFEMQSESASLARAEQPTSPSSSSLASDGARVGDGGS